jgi:hypothetical protein
MAILFFMDALGASTAFPPDFAVFLTVTLAFGPHPAGYHFLTRCREFNRIQTNHCDIKPLNAGLR